MEKGFNIPIFDKGHVRYLGNYGTDATIVEAARVSYHSKSKGPEADKKLLEYLYKNRHTSPFEQCSIQFNIKMPIFCMRQFVRHRTFKLNEMSARYQEMWDDFYVPGEWRLQDVKNKQSSILPTGDMSNPLVQKTVTDNIIALYSQCYHTYKELLNLGIAKEMARFVLPVANYTEIVVTTDLHNLMHFLRLRLDPHAQWEMQVIATAMYDIAKELYPWTFEAFEKYQVQVSSSAAPLDPPKLKE